VHTVLRRQHLRRRARRRAQRSPALLRQSAAGAAVDPRATRTATAERLALETIARLSYVDEILWLAAASPRAWRHAHERGVLHRVLEPANILVTDEGSRCWWFQPVGGQALGRGGEPGVGPFPASWILFTMMANCWSAVVSCIMSARRAKLPNERRTGALSSAKRALFGRCGDLSYLRHVGVQLEGKPADPDRQSVVEAL
jgi:serine/threonine protein kinase